jgi:hypothetical protein
MLEKVLLKRINTVLIYTFQLVNDSLDLTLNVTLWIISGGIPSLIYLSFKTK